MLDLVSFPVLEDPWPDSAVLSGLLRTQNGTVLFRQGDPVETLYLIVSGCVKLTCADDQGHDSLLALRTAGWLLGVAAAVLDRPHPATAQAVEVTGVRPLNVRDFTRLRQNERIVPWIQRMQSREIYDAVELLALLHPAEASVRLERLLIKLALAGHERAPDGTVRLSHQLRHEEMAQAVATSRETVTRLLTALDKRGHIRRDRGRLQFPGGSKLAAQVLQASLMRR